METYQTAATTQQPKPVSAKTEVLQALEEFATALGECGKLLPAEPAESQSAEQFAQMRIAFEMMICGCAEVRHTIESNWLDPAEQP